MRVTLFKRGVLLSLLTLLSVPLAARTPPGKIDLLAVQTEAWRTLMGPRVDTEAFRRLATPDFIYVEGNGKTYTLEENVVALATCSFQSFQIETPQTRWLSADSALLVYHLRLDGACHGHKIPSDFEISSVWVKHNSRWRVQLYAETVIEPSK